MTRSLLETIILFPDCHWVWISIVQDRFSKPKVSVYYQRQNLECSQRFGNGSNTFSFHHAPREQHREQKIASPHCITLTLTHTKKKVSSIRCSFQGPIDNYISQGESSTAGAPQTVFCWLWNILSQHGGIKWLLDGLSSN